MNLVAGRGCGTASAACLALLIAASSALLGVAGRVPVAGWSLAFDAPSGVVTSLSTLAAGGVELVDSVTSAANLPHAAVDADTFPIALSGPCASVADNSWSCVGSITLPSSAGGCGGLAVLSAEYNVTLEPLAGTPWACLRQSVALALVDAACPPTSFVAVVLPRAATLAGTAAKR